MAHSTVFILALVASGISIISGRHVPDHSEIPVGSITEMTFGKIVKFTCPVIYGRYPHPENCEFFYECRFGKPTLMHCNRGYLYDRQREQCRDRRVVKCHIGDRGGHDHHRDHKDKDRGGHDNHRDHKDKDVQVKEDMKYFKCPYIWGAFAHPYDCSKYFVCIYNSPKLFQCNRNFLYDERYRKCLPQNKVNCGKRLDRDQMRTSRKPASTTTAMPVESTTSGVSVTTENPSSFDKTTHFPTFTTLVPSTMKKIPEITTTSSQTPTDATTTPSTTETPVPTTATPTITTTTTPFPTTATPTTSTITTQVPTTATPTTTTAVPTTVTPTTITAVPTTATPTTTTAVPTTATTTPTPTTATSSPTTTPVSATTTSSPTTTPIPARATSPTTIASTTITSTPTTFTTPSPVTSTQKLSTPLPDTKPNTPPPTDCDEDDLDCIIDVTGDVVKWFDCPRRFGHFPHGSSSQLFIHCDNWRPFVKKCADETYFSPTYHVCVWADKTKGLQ